MRKANLIKTAIWVDPDFLTLSADARLVYLMLITQPEVSHVGRVAIPVKHAAHMTGLSEKRIGDAMGYLVAAGFVLFDETIDEVVIRSWVKHNVSGEKREAAAVAAIAHVLSPAIRSSLQSLYPSLFGEPLDTLSDTPSDTVADTLSAIHRDRDRDREVVSDLKNDADVIFGEVEKPFDRVWKVYTEYHPQAVPTAKRRKLLADRLKERDGSDLDPVGTMMAAVVGNHQDPYCNDHGHHDWELIFRNQDKVERYAGIAVFGAPQPDPRSIAGRLLVKAAELRRQEQQEATWSDQKQLH